MPSKFLRSKFTFVAKVNRIFRAKAQQLANRQRLRDRWVRKYRAASQQRKWSYYRRKLPQGNRNLGVFD